MEGSTPNKPNEVAVLEAAYGQPSSAGFGSAVFYDLSKLSDDLEKMAINKYRYFVGDLWDRYGEEAWMEPWSEVFTRSTSPEHDIVEELQRIKDRDAAMSVSMLLDNVEDPDEARAALSAVYDAPDMTELRVYTLGDGAAMSGILIAGRRAKTGQTIFLLFLMD